VVLSQELRRAESELEDLDRQRSELLIALPNPPDDSAPDGYSDEDALELRRVGKPAEFRFTPRDHVELSSVAGASGGGLERPGFDLERGARVSGARFAYRRGAVALVELALYRYAIDRLVGRVSSSSSAGAGAGVRDVRHGLSADRRGQLVPGHQ